MKDTFLDQLDAPADLERGPEIILDNFAGGGQATNDPLHTLGNRDTFGLVTVEIDGTTYAITWPNGPLQLPNSEDC